MRTDDGWLVNGQKVWTSFATHAQRCVLLTRTGTPESAHRGITALFVDMATPGITPRPLDALHGVPELCEVFFDNVVVPFERTLGAEGQGWAVAMDLLPYERSTALWHRGALLHRRLEQLVADVPEGAVTPSQAGDAYLDLFAFRARSWATQHRMASGGRLGAETSIDKVLLAVAEQSLFDLALDGLDDQIVVGDDADERAVAVGVPVLPGGVDLRRQRRDPAEHHRPSPARPRRGSVMDARGSRALRAQPPLRHRDGVG